MTGKAGRLSFYLGSSKDQGKWWVKGNRLCQKWTRWLDSAENCIRIKIDGEKLTWRRDDGMTGTATLLPDTRPKMDMPPAYALGGPPPDSDVDVTSDTPNQQAAHANAPVNSHIAPIALLEPLPDPSKVSASVRIWPSEWTSDVARAKRQNILPSIIELTLRSRLASRWCRVVSPASQNFDQNLNAAFDHSQSESNMPDLVIASRLVVGVRTALEADASCVSARPYLQEVARVLLPGN